jgi:hypothetical protein
LEQALEDFDKHKFLRELSRDDIFVQPRVSDIEHPTLRFLHKWMGFVFFPWDDPHKVIEGDLQLMYAAVKKIRVLPVRLLVEHWLATPNLKGAVGCTLLVTRIAFGLNLLENASLEYINEFRPYIGYEHFRHAHLLKREGDGLHMLYP